MPKTHLPLLRTEAMPWAPRSVFDARPNSVKIYQIDTTNFCNAKCSYCPHPTHERERGFISEETFKATMRVMKNKEVSLHHFGEPLLHKGLERLIEIAVAHGVDVGFSTNAEILTQERLDRLAAVGLKWLRLHTDPFGIRLSQFRVPEGLEFTEHALEADNDAPKKDMVSFSGHLDMAPQKRGIDRCSYLHDQWAVVLWDGSFALCCHDIEGTRSADLCQSCEGYVFKSPRDWGNYDG